MVNRGWGSKKEKGEGRLARQLPVMAMQAARSSMVEEVVGGVWEKTREGKKVGEVSG